MANLLLKGFGKMGFFIFFYFMNERFLHDMSGRAARCSYVLHPATVPV